METVNQRLLALEFEKKYLQDCLDLLYKSYRYSPFFEQDDGYQLTDAEFFSFADNHLSRTVNYVFAISGWIAGIEKEIALLSGEEGKNG